ncbi:MAG TPA: DUF899 family protein [Candidatus Angelobacter sp.]|nr:DUF899 family protein [Candidatus Angelobacter sp.]
MSFEIIQDTFRVTNLKNESAEYLAKRDELRIAEIEMMRQIEQVAAMRRKLPKGQTMEDYVFQEGPADLSAGDEPVRTVRLSELFTAPNRSLILYQFMFGKKNTNPCPMCTMFIDGWNGVAHHLAQNVDVAIVAAADPKELRAHARKRGWDNLRLLSCGMNTFKFDMGSEDGEGNQDSAVSVFTKESDGAVCHFYTARPWVSKEIRERGEDMLSPVYNVLDLTPQGRGDWYASFQYPIQVKR